MQHNIHAELLSLREGSKDEGDLRQQLRVCLSLVGFVQPPKGRGIRILSIDGGGTRYVMHLLSDHRNRYPQLFKSVLQGHDFAGDS